MGVFFVVVVGFWGLFCFVGISLVKMLCPACGENLPSGGECSKLEQVIIREQQQGCIDTRLQFERVKRETTEGAQRNTQDHFQKE